MALWKQDFEWSSTLHLSEQSVQVKSVLIRTTILLQRRVFYEPYHSLTYSRCFQMPCDGTSPMLLQCSLTAQSSRHRRPLFLPPSSRSLYATQVPLASANVPSFPEVYAQRKFHSHLPMFPPFFGPIWQSGSGKKARNASSCGTAVSIPRTEGGPRHQASRTPREADASPSPVLA